MCQRGRGFSVGSHIFFPWRSPGWFRSRSCFPFLKLQNYYRPPLIFLSIAPNTPTGETQINLFLNFINIRWKKKSIQNYAYNFIITKFHVQPSSLQRCTTTRFRFESTLASQRTDASRWKRNIPRGLVATRGHCRSPAESYNDRLIGHACGNRTIEDTTTRRRSADRRPSSAQTSTERNGGGGGHWTGPCGRCTRPACSAIRDPFPAIGRKREIGKSPAENCTTRGQRGWSRRLIDECHCPIFREWISRRPWILDSFLFWVETWNYWKLRSILVKSFKMEGRSLDSFFFLSWNLKLLEIKERWKEGI